MDTSIIKNELNEKLKEFSLNQYAFFNPDVIIFSEDVRKMCESNACGKYGTNWQCPPAVGSVAENCEKCRNYDNALVFNTVNEIEDSFDFEGMMEAGAKHKKKAFEIREYMRSLNCDFLMFGAGGCAECSKCAYLDGEPCRKPNDVMPAMEACGIYVVDLCEATGLKYINGQNTVTYFSLILF